MYLVNAVVFQLWIIANKSISLIVSSQRWQNGKMSSIWVAGSRYNEAGSGISSIHPSAEKLLFDISPEIQNVSLVMLPWKWWFTKEVWRTFVPNVVHSYLLTSLKDVERYARFRCRPIFQGMSLTRTCGMIVCHSMKDWLEKNAPEPLFLPTLLSGTCVVAFHAT